MPFAIECTSEIEPGVTRTAELRAWIGEPVGVERRGSGWATWCYVHVEATERDTGTFARIAAWLAYFVGLRAPLGPRPPVNVAQATTTRHELEVFLDAAGVVRNLPLRSGGGAEPAGIRTRRKGAEVAPGRRAAEPRARAGPEPPASRGLRGDREGHAA